MIPLMRFRPALLALALTACSTSQNARVTHMQSLSERAQYASLDKQAVEVLAQAAKDFWPQEFSAFTFQAVEQFASGGVSHWMSIWVHKKTGLEFMLLPGGTFLMGSPLGEASRRMDESQHEVKLDPFLIARTECTWAAWKKGASVAAQAGDPFAGSDQLPISGISPLDVEAWCSEAGLSFPTEAQWEYMCRAGTTTAWTMGADKSGLARFGNVGSLECPEQWIQMDGFTEDWHDGFGNATAPAATFECNAFGLFDVHGNLSEWCRDQYFIYSVEAEIGTGARLRHSGERIARGGNYGGDASAARSARRLTVGAGISAGNHGFGFRPSVDLPLRH